VALRRRAMVSLRGCFGPFYLKTTGCQGSRRPNDSHRRPRHNLPADRGALVRCRRCLALTEAGSKPSRSRAQAFRCRTRRIVLGRRVGTGESDPPRTSTEAEQNIPVAYARSSISSLPSSFFRSAATTQRTVSMSLIDSPSERPLTQGACNSIAASKVRFPFSVSTMSWARR
jgi:hypothetical protein